MRVGILTGPTATGKTSLALELAERSGGVEIINADSMLVYRGMDIGTAKPAPGERARVPHHLIDIRDPDEPFTAGDFVREARRAIAEIESRGRRALIAGGTGFYLKALLYGLWEAPPADLAVRAKLEARADEELFLDLLRKDGAAASRIGRSDRYRLVRALEIVELTGKTPSQLEAAEASDPDPRYALWVTDREDAELLDRIRTRTRQMIEAGWLDEARLLAGRYPGARALGAVGYAQVLAHIEGREPEGRKPEPGQAGLESEIVLATRQLVKRQRTWFRGEKSARWFILDRDRRALEEEWKALYG